VSQLTHFKEKQVRCKQDDELLSLDKSDLDKAVGVGGMLYAV